MKVINQRAYSIGSSFLVLIVVVIWTTSAMATEPRLVPVEEDEEAESARHILEFGANIRTDFGVRALRLDAAWTTPSIRALLVLDPMFWSDGQTSTDVVGMWRTQSFEPFAGWRLNTVPLVEGSQLQHNLLVGTAIRFPDFLDGRIGGQWGIEMAMMIVKHGGGVASNTIGFDSGRHYIDLVNFGMFARFHYNLGL